MAKKNSENDYTIGQLYRSIDTDRSEFEKPSNSLASIKIQDINPFVKFCKDMHKKFPSFGKNPKITEQEMDAIEFLGWDLKPYEFMAAQKAALILTILVGIPGVLILYILFPDLLGSLLNVPILIEGIDFFFLTREFFENILALIILILVAIGIGFMSLYSVKKYPESEAKQQQTKSLTYVPEMIGYMTMSMKLSPNLEKSIEFAAEHGKGKIAEEFQKLIWNTQIGVYASLSEGLDSIAYRWGKYSREFKQALMRIRGSVLEPTEAKRYQLLDKTMLEVLDSVKIKMEDYARKLMQPSVMLFYLGVLLPLILIIILPIGSAFSGQAYSTPLILVLLYNIGIPIGAFFFAKNVISTRPPTYDPPLIPKNYPGLPPKWKMKIKNNLIDIRLVLLIVLVVGSMSAAFISIEGLPPKSLLGKDAELYQIIQSDNQPREVQEENNLPTDPETYFYVGEGGTLYEQELRSYNDVELAKAAVIMERQKFFSDPQNDLTPYNFAFGMMILVSIMVFILIHYTYVYRRKIQLEIIQMEAEFKDAMYILASRMGENRPVEDALKHTRDFLPGALISKKIFSKTIENIEVMGMTLRNAIFDPQYGSLKFIPSNQIRTSMKLLVDSVELGVNVAARTLISMSLQLENMEKVNRNLKTLISDVTGTMSTMAMFIAPFVLGITSALQKIVMLTLSGIVGSGIDEMSATSTSISGVPGMSTNLMGNSLSITPDIFAQLATPIEFLIILIIYVIEIVIILTYFTTKVEEDNDLLFKLNLAKAVPIAIIVFIVAVLMGNFAIGSF